MKGAPTVIKNFPSADVEQFRLQHGGLLETDAGKWDALLASLPEGKGNLTIAGNLVRDLILDYKTAMTRRQS